MYARKGRRLFLRESGVLHLASQSPLALGARLINAKWIDRSLPRRWKEKCNAEHTCTSPESRAYMARHLPLWVVDTWNQCLVPCSTSTPYVALSYVWGGTPIFTALKDNLEYLQFPGSLAGDHTKNIPKTIRDAMFFAQILGERYFWVDSLCIVQDDAQMMAEIATMGAIYAQASITIVAADGDNADVGLRGLHGLSGPRSVRQVVHSLGRDAALIETFGPRGRRPGSVWATRGWTFQEGLFSRRKIIFTHGVIRWVCHEAIWDEYADAGDPEPIIFTQFVPNLEELVNVVRDFNSKKLTFPEDALLAFSGIASALGNVFQGGLVSGIAVTLFHIGLLWEPISTMSRRVPKRAAGDFCLPSWSWAGWEGDEWVPVRGHVVNYVKRRNRSGYGTNFEQVFPLVDWSWANAPQGPRTRIQESWHIRREAFWNKIHTSCPPGWTRYRIEDPSTLPSWQIATQPQPDVLPLCFYKHESEPDSEFWFPPPMPGRNEPPTAHIVARYITCRTRRGWLISGEAISVSIRPGRPILSLRDRQGNWAGLLILWEFMDREEQGIKIELELVEIAQGRIANNASDRNVEIEEWRLDERPKTEAFYEYFYVLWIEWKEDVAYKKGLGRVHKNAWESQTLEWIDLVLG